MSVVLENGVANVGGVEVGRWQMSWFWLWDTDGEEGVQGLGYWVDYMGQVIGMLKWVK